MKLRIARHTFDLERISRFYQEALDLKALGSFEDHEEYDGVFLGVPGENSHLEFTVSPDTPNNHPDEDDLLVFYVPGEQYPAFVEKVCRAGAAELPAKNLNPDGFRFVISKIQ